MQNIRLEISGGEESERQQQTADFAAVAAAALQCTHTPQRCPLRFGSLKPQQLVHKLTIGGVGAAAALNAATALLLLLLLLEAIIWHVLRPCQEQRHPS